MQVIRKLYAEQRGYAITDVGAKSVSWLSLLGATEDLESELEVSSKGSIIIDGSITTGTKRHQAITFDTFDWDTQTVTTDPSKKKGEISYTIGNSTLSNSLQRELKQAEDGYKTYQDTNADLKKFYGDEITRIKAELAAAGGGSSQSALMIDVAPINASAGEIRVWGDALYGTGSFTSSGDASVTIENNTPALLNINGIIISESVGGLFFNGKEIEKNADIQAEIAAQAAFEGALGDKVRSRIASLGISRVDEAAISVSTTVGFAKIATPPSKLTDEQKRHTISIVNTYVDLNKTYPKALIRVSGNILNYGGALQVVNPYGDVEFNAQVAAKSLTVFSGGSFIVQGVSKFNSNADAYAKFKSATKNGTEAAEDSAVSSLVSQRTTSPSIMADRIIIKAEYINLDGNIQSGRDNITVTINESTEAEIRSIIASGSSATRVKLNTVQTNDVISYYDVNSGTKRNIGGTTVYYDKSDGKIKMSEMAIKGGYIELHGRLLNTGNGEINVLGGYGTININNNTSYDVQTSRVDVSKRGTGTLLLVDKSKALDGSYSTLYQYQEDGSVQKKVNGAGATTVGKSSTYDITNGQRAGWTVGEKKQTETSHDTYKIEILGIPYSSKLVDALGFTPDPQTSDPLTRNISPPKLMGEGTYYYTDTSDSSQYSYDSKRVGFNYGDAGYSASDATYFTPSVEKYFAHKNKVVNSWEAGFTIDLGFLGSIHIGDVTIMEEFETREITEERYTELHTHTVKADYDLKINFFGAEKGAVNIQSSKQGADVILGDNILNTTGKTTVSSQGRIIQKNSISSVNGQAVELHGREGIGEGTLVGGYFAINTNVEDDSISGLIATSEVGNVFINEVTGSIAIEEVKAASRGNVALTAKGDIYSTSSKAIYGGKVVVKSSAGSIAKTSDTPVLLDTTDKVTLTAANSISVEEIATDLALVEALADSGDVYIKVTNGQLSDGNEIAVRDERTYDALLNGVWKDLQLTEGAGAEGKKQEIINGFKVTKEREYFAYWAYRNMQVDTANYDASFEVKLSDAERSYYENELSFDANAIQALEEKRTAEYHTLHGEWGSEGNALQTDYSYAVSDEDKTRLTADVKVWTEGELLSLLGAGLMKPVTDTQTSIENVNILGQNITIITKGNTGDSNGRLNIVMDGALSDDERVELSAAERTDVSFLILESPIDAKVNFFHSDSGADTIKRTDGGSWVTDGLVAGMDIQLDNTKLNTVKGVSNLQIASVTADTITLRSSDSLQTEYTQTIQLLAVVLDPLAEGATPFKAISLDKKDDIDITGLGNLSVTSGGVALIGSEKTINLNTVEAVGEVRIKTAESILNGVGGDTINVIGANTILEAANGSIGTADRVIRMNLLPDATLTTRSLKGTYLTETDGNMNIEAIFSKTDEVVLKTENGSILDALNHDFEKIKAKGITLTAIAGGVGEADDFVETDLTGESSIKVTADNNIYINELVANMNIDQVTSNKGDVYLKADVSLVDTVADGSGLASLPRTDITGNNITLEARKGGIGNSGNDIDIDSSNFARGVLTSTSFLHTYLIETTGDLYIHSVSTDNAYTAFILSAKRILNGNPNGHNVVSGKTRLFAGGDIGEEDNRLFSKVGFMEGKSIGGTAWIHNTGLLTLGGMDEEKGFIAKKSINLLTDSPIVINKDLVAETGDIVIHASEIKTAENNPTTFAETEALAKFTASGKAKTDYDHLTINSGKTVEAKQGSVYLWSGDDTTIQSGATVKAKDTIEVRIDYLKNDGDGTSGATLQADGTMEAVDIKLIGGIGNDVIDASKTTRNDDANFLIWGNEGSDKLTGTTKKDFIFGDKVEVSRHAGTTVISKVVSIETSTGGIDTIDGLDGDNVIIAGVGADDIKASEGADIAAGDNAEVTFSTGSVVVQAKTIDFAIGGNDTFDLGNGTGKNIALGGFGADQITTGTGDNSVIGDNGQVDFINGIRSEIKSLDTTNDTGGDDVIKLGDGLNQVVAGVGKDNVTGGALADYIISDNGVIQYDAVGTIKAAFTTDPLLGDDDIVDAKAGDNIVLTGAGADQVISDTGNDIILTDFGKIDFNIDNAGLSTGKLKQAISTDFDKGGNDTVTSKDGEKLIVTGFGADNVTTGDGVGSSSIAADNAHILFSSTGIRQQIKTLDTVAETGGDDKITLGNSNSQVLGGVGKDTIKGGNKSDYIIGDNGVINYDTKGVILNIQTLDTHLGDIDTITDEGGSNIILGGRFGDVITAKTGTDLILGDFGRFEFNTDSNGDSTSTVKLAISTDIGEGGDDVINVADGEKLIIAGHGADKVTAGDGTGNTTVSGDSAEVNFYTDGVRKQIKTIDTTNDTGGNDEITIGNTISQVLGGIGSDIIKTGNLADYIISDNGVINYDTKGAILNAQTQDTQLGDIDTITDEGGDNIILAGRNADKITTKDGDDLILGDFGRFDFDTDSVGDSTGKLISALSTDIDQGGNDEIEVGNGDKTIIGGFGADKITAENSSKNSIVSGDSAELDFYSNGNQKKITTLDTAEATGGVDVIKLGNGDAQVLGSIGADEITAKNGDVSVLGDNGFFDYDSAGRLVLAKTEDHSLGGADIITLGDGDNVVLAGVGGDNVVSGNGNSAILGDNGQITFSGGIIQKVSSVDSSLGGNDTIVAGNGNNSIIAGAAADKVTTGNGNSSTIGDNGEITFSGGVIQKVISVDFSIGGNDSLTSGNGNNAIIGGFGADSIKAGVGNGSFLGDNGIVTFTNGIRTFIQSLDTTASTGANDTIDIGGGFAIAGVGSDTIKNSQGESVLIGDNGYVIADSSGRYIETRTGSTTLGGSDNIIGGSNRDIIFGGVGGDTVNGGAGDDFLFGDAGKVTREQVIATSEFSRNKGKLVERIVLQTVDLFTGSADLIITGAGQDIAFGGAGNDVFIADGRNDTVIGNYGRIVLEDGIIQTSITLNQSGADKGDDTGNVDYGRTVSIRSASDNESTLDKLLNAATVSFDTNNPDSDSASGNILYQKDDAGLGKDYAANPLMDSNQVLDYIRNEAPILLPNPLVRNLNQGEIDTTANDTQTAGLPAGWQLYTQGTEVASLDKESAYIRHGQRRSNGDFMSWDSMTA